MKAEEIIPGDFLVVCDMSWGGLVVSVVQSDAIRYRDDSVTWRVLMSWNNSWCVTAQGLAHFHTHLSDDVDDWACKIS